VSAVVAQLAAHASGADQPTTKSGVCAAMRVNYTAGACVTSIFNKTAIMNTVVMQMQRIATATLLKAAAIAVV
jgi:hypothetical protein